DLAMCSRKNGPRGGGPSKMEGRPRRRPYLTRGGGEKRTRSRHAHGNFDLAEIIFECRAARPRGKFRARGGRGNRRVETRRREKGRRGCHRADRRAASRRRRGGV